jgi:hypothetical protein
MTSAASPRASRLTRALAFVAIVWALAGSFVAFELAALGLFGLVLDTAPGRGLAISSTVRDATTCLPPPAASGAAASRAGAGGAQAWTLGVTSGTYAMTSRWEAGAQPSAEPVPEWQAIARRRAAEAARVVREVAAELDVPVPPRFTAQDRADAFPAYTAFVEEDAAGTARRLAAAYSETTCHLFKLGAYWGYALEVRAMLPGERAAFAIEMEFHGRRAGVPDALWTPMIEGSGADTTVAERVAEIEAITGAVTGYLTAAR